MAEKPGFLPNLTTSFIELHKKENLGTLEFATACGQVLPIFDHIGERRTQRELAPACTHACRRRPLAESSLSAASSLHPVCRALFTAPTFTAPCRHRLPHRQVRVLGQGAACIGTGRQRRRCRNTAECTQSLASAGRGLSRGVCVCRPAGRVERYGHTQAAADQCWPTLWLPQRETLVKVAEQYPALKDVVEAGKKVRAGRVWGLRRVAGCE